MRIVVCDDELDEVEAICAHLKEICKQTGIQAELRGFVSCEEFLAYTAKNYVDIVFLDICMGAYNGIDAARILRRTNETCAIVFVTASREYAVDAFDVTACHYLVKPATPAKLREALHRTQRLHHERRTLSIVSNYINTRVPIDDILYIDILDRTTQIHLRNRSVVEAHLPLSTISGMLIDEPRFMFCQRSAIFNAEMVQHMGDDYVELTDHTILAIPPKRYAKVRADYREYLFSKVRGSHV